jgi:catechol 2,3-dioxygenase-like lactoylglutathione lyase family enzyme
MAVTRIVANICAGNVAAAKAFYGDVLEMDVAMDMGWIVTFAADATAAPQVTVASEGGSGTVVPDLSIEVDDFDDVYRRVRAGGFAIEYGPVTEPWGVRRFYVRDPFGRLVNILTHVA